jgi:hypothetical protein
MVPKFNDAWIYESERKAASLVLAHLSVAVFTSALTNPAKFCLYGRMNQFEDRWTNFHKILYWGEVTQSLNFPILVKIGQK